MAFTQAFVSNARLNSLRFTTRCLAPQTPCYSRLWNSRPFSSMLQPAARLTASRFRVMTVTTRHYTKPTSEPSVTVSSTPLDNATPPETVSAGVDQLTSTTGPPIEEFAPDLVDAVIPHLPPALQYGDLAALGLVSWTPAGLIRWSFELINVTTGLPWFWTIVAGSIFWKLVLVPLSVQGLRNSARILPLQPKIEEYKNEMNRIRVSGDKLALQRHALKMRKLYADAGVSMGATALVPLVQIPVTLGMFFGVRKMCALPVAQLTDSGLAMLPDLTVADPYMLLPVLLCAAVNLQISVGASELNLQERPEMGHIMNGLRILSVLGVWVMSSFPAGLMVSLLTTSLATTVQSLAFQHPPIRRALNIPTVPREMRGRLPSPMSTVEYVIKMWKNKVAEASNGSQGQRKRR